MLFWMDASRNRMVCYHLIYKRCVLPCCVCYTTGSDVTTWWQCCGSGRIRNEFDKNYSEKLINLTISQQNAQFKIVIYVKNIRTNSCRIGIRSWIWIRNYLKSRIRIRHNHSGSTTLLDGINQIENMITRVNVAGTQPDTSLKVPRFTWPRIARPHTTDR
jgi:hypothetical protein